MPRRKLIAGNWKLHLGPEASAVLAMEIHRGSLGWDDVDLAVFPTALSLTAVTAALRESAVAVATKNTCCRSMNSRSFGSITS